MKSQFSGCLLALGAGEARLCATGRSSGAVSQAMLCVLESYCAQGGLDAYDMADRLRELYQYNPGGFDRLEREACRRLAEGYSFERAAREAWETTSKAQHQSPGCLPRVIPAALLRYHDDARLVGESRLICGLTHYGESCKLACTALNLALAHILMVGTDGLIEEVLDFIAPRSPDLAKVLRQIQRLQPRDLSGGPEHAALLQTALWIGTYCDTFTEAKGVIAEIPATGPVLWAVSGALLGARLGRAAVPEDWVAGLSQRGRLESCALRLYDLAMQP